MKLHPVILPVDKALHRISGGRLSLLGMVGMPALRLVTTGRKTGLERANDLLYTPYGDAYVIIGSGWGRPTHPVWTLNLAANPEATIIVRGRRIPVLARRAQESEVPGIWRAAVANWPGYEMEKRLAGDREFRIFVLTVRRVRP